MPCLVLSCRKEKGVLCWGWVGVRGGVKGPSQKRTGIEKIPTNRAMQWRKLQRHNFRIKDRVTGKGYVVRVTGLGLQG